MRFWPILASLVLALPAVSGSVLSVAPGDSIQIAIAMARPGDVVQVGSGTYYEHLRIDRPVVLRGTGMPVIDGTASGSGITVEADGVRLEGFRAINAGRHPGDDSGEAGIMVLSDNNTIIGNDASHNSIGILVRGRNNTIMNNTASFNLGLGMRLEGSGNVLSNNSIEGNNRCDLCDLGNNIWVGVAPGGCC